MGIGSPRDTGDAGDAASLWRAKVMHRRAIAPLYRFTYTVFYLLIDIDRQAEAAQSSRLFSVGRFNLASFHAADFGARDGSALRPWAERMLEQYGITLDGGRIQLLCMPRILGHGFNPISLFYCQHADGGLRAIIAQVRNTFGEQHCYVLHAGGAVMDLSRSYTADKLFHVSPFLDVAGSYRFRFAAPINADKLRVLIDEFSDTGGTGDPVMTATLFGRQRPLTSLRLLALCARVPMVSLKVVLGIHWQALKLWLRGAGYRPKPPPPAQDHS